MSRDHPHGHPHEQGHDHPHPHPLQPDIEDGPLTYPMALVEAVLDLVEAKGILDADEIRQMIERMDARSPATGARLVARAWLDPAFKARLALDLNKAAAELGIDAGPIPIRAVENTATTHNLIVCTLCSCYPTMLLGLPPDWYKARAYRSRAVREPRAVLGEFGLGLAANVAVTVHDSTADFRYLVLPMRPPGTDGWDEERLADLVTRDCMIGTAVPQAS